MKKSLVMDNNAVFNRKVKRKVMLTKRNCVSTARVVPSVAYRTVMKVLTPVLVLDHFLRS